MPRSVSFTIEHEPVAKGRPRSMIKYKRDGEPFVHVYTDSKTEKYEKLVKQYAALYCKKPLLGPVEIKAVFYFPIMPSWTKAIKEAALGQYKTSKPDTDNLLKALEDGMNGVVFQDDSQIVKTLAAKRYVDTPHAKGRTVVTVTEL